MPKLEAASAQDSSSLLMPLVSSGNLIAVQTFLKENSVDFTDKSNALKEAKRLGYLDIARCLESYALGQQRATKQHAAHSLIDAVEQGDLLEAETLMRMGADIFLPGSKGAQEAFLVALQNKDIAMLHLFERYGHELKEEKERADSSALAFLHHYKLVTATLVQAVQNGDIERVHQCLQKGANINGSVGGRNPLIVAVEKNNLPMVQFLVEHGATVNPLLRAGAQSEIKKFLATHQKHNEALLLFAKNGNKADVERYIEKNANIHFQDEAGASVLEHAISSRNLPLSEDLKDKMDPRRRYLKEAIGANHPHSIEDLCTDKDRAFSRLQEADPHFKNIQARVNLMKQ